jgi:hypothetical protein
MLIKSIAAIAVLGLTTTAAFAADAPRTSQREVAKPKTEVIKAKTEVTKPKNEVTKPKNEVTRPKGLENVRAGSGGETPSANRGR